MLDGLKKIGKSIGVWEDDPAKPVEQPKAVAPQQAPIMQQAQGYTFPTAPAVPGPMVGLIQVQQHDEQLYAAITAAISTGVVDNLARLRQMSEQMKAAIPDEGMRIKAAAAACGLTAADIISTIDTLAANVEVEKVRFMSTDIAAMNTDIAALNKQVEDLIAEIAKKTEERDALYTQVQSQTQNVANLTSVFEATAAKLLQDLDLEKKKIGIYIPQEIK